MPVEEVETAPWTLERAPGYRLIEFSYDMPVDLYIAENLGLRRQVFVCLRSVGRSVGPSVRPSV